MASLSWSEIFCVRGYLATRLYESPAMIGVTMPQQTRKIQRVAVVQEYTPFRLSSSTWFCVKPERLKAATGIAPTTATTIDVGTVMAV